jgi:membrane-associated phospholipid phosphatase
LTPRIDLRARVFTPASVVGPRRLDDARLAIEEMLTYSGHLGVCSEETPGGWFVQAPGTLGDYGEVSSFPSGHSASVLAFASAAGWTIPPLSLPLHLAARAIA